MMKNIKVEPICPTSQAAFTGSARPKGLKSDLKKTGALTRKVNNGVCSGWEARFGDWHEREEGERGNVIF